MSALAVVGSQVGLARHKAGTDLPEAAFVMGTRAHLASGYGLPLISQDRVSFQRWEKIRELGPWSLGTPWRMCSLGLPLPRSSAGCSTARPRPPMACTHYTVTHRHGLEPRPAHSHLYLQINSPQVHTHLAHMHAHTFLNTSCVPTCAPALHSHTPAEQDPAGPMATSTTLPGPSLLP